MSPSATPTPQTTDRTSLFQAGSANKTAHHRPGSGGPCAREVLVPRLRRPFRRGETRPRGSPCRRQLAQRQRRNTRGRVLCPGRPQPLVIVDIAVPELNRAPLSRRPSISGRRRIETPTGNIGVMPDAPRLRRAAPGRATLPPLPPGFRTSRQHPQVATHPSPHPRRDRHACTRCGTGQRLEVHRLDGNWRNNNPANLAMALRLVPQRHSRREEPRRPTARTPA